MMGMAAARRMVKPAQMTPGAHWALAVCRWRWRWSWRDWLSSCSVVSKLSFRRLDCRGCYCTPLHISIRRFNSSPFTNRFCFNHRRQSVQMTCHLTTFLTIVLMICSCLRRCCWHLSIPWTYDVDLNGVIYRSISCEHWRQHKNNDN